ncbi:hypothetical protein [Leptothermofonsia sp. ETS-13]|uniref:hypothetical protein n=1 Tax=Leptothermofonsia sp. ETS-13 TaxID=3035696 RepID=UPI003BA2968C
MSDEANNILKQASQGSVAAIIQVLNEKLADSGVRTRAVFADGVLQLLCEAATLEQLEQSVLVERVRQILEAIAPRNIRRVNINSRIVREQQLLWLEEISRDPQNQLLWSEEITLRKPNFFQQFLTDWKTSRGESTRAELPRFSPRRLREQKQFWRGLTGGASLSLLLLLVGWALYQKFGTSALKQTQLHTGPTTASSPPASPVSTPAVSSSPSPAPNPPVSQGDAFVRAVRLAEQASRAGLSAKSSAEWLELAARWQQASDLMASVPDKDPRYQTAQNRAVAYQRNSEAALQQADKYKAQLSETPEQTDFSEQSQ